MPNGVILELFEVMDVNGDGVISEEEWSDNFVAYVNTILKAASEQEDGQPVAGTAAKLDRSPALQANNRRLATLPMQIPAKSRQSSGAGNAPLSLGRRRGSAPDLQGASLATSPSSPTGFSSWTLPPLESSPGKHRAEPTSPTTPLAVPGSLLAPPPRKPSLPSRKGTGTTRLTKSDRGVCDSSQDGRQNRTLVRRSMTGDNLTDKHGRSPQLTGSVAAGNLKARRASSTGVTGRRPSFTPCRQSDRSVVAPPQRKQAVLVQGHQGLNWRSHHSAFDGELIRAETMKVR